MRMMSLLDRILSSTGLLKLVGNNMMRDAAEMAAELCWLYDAGFVQADGSRICVHCMYTLPSHEANCGLDRIVRKLQKPTLKVIPGEKQ